MFNGASQGIYKLLEKLITDSNCGIMYSIPQYPIYSGLVGLFGGKDVHYYLNEEDNWGIEHEELDRSYQEAIKKGVNVKALVIINPGNPTGSVLNEHSINEILEFAERRNILVIADEVYQENIYQGQFISFKKVLCKANRKVQLASFHSLSKGIFGECGLRGGYMEAHNLGKPFLDYFKDQNQAIIPNTIGQIGMCFMARFLSGNIMQNISADYYKEIQREYKEIYSSLLFRADTAVKRLKEMKGVTSNPIMGAMYLFP